MGFRVFGCKVESKIGINLKTLHERKEPRYYMGTSSTKLIIRYWIPSKPEILQYYTISRLFEQQTLLPNGQPSPGARIQMVQHPSMVLPPFTTINSTNHPFHDSPPQVIHMPLPPKGKVIGIAIEECTYHNMPYIKSSAHKSDNMRHNIWMLVIGNSSSITSAQAIVNLQAL